MNRKFFSILYAPYKYLVFAPILALSTFILGTLTLVLVHFFNPRTASFVCGRTWARINSYVTPMFVSVIGRENIDPEQSYVIVSNHQSQFDIFVLYGWLDVDFKWVMKKELRKVPVLGYACDKLGHIYIDRSKTASAVASLSDAKNKIVGGTSVIFFPEGTRSVSGEMGEFKKGAFMMALDLGLPILPVSMIDTRKILPSKSLALLPGRAKMVIHRPVPVEEYDPANVQVLMTRVRETIKNGLDEYES